MPPKAKVADARAFPKLPRDKEGGILPPRSFTPEEQAGLDMAKTKKQTDEIQQLGQELEAVLEEREKDR